MTNTDNDTSTTAHAADVSRLADRIERGWGRWSELLIEERCLIVAALRAYSPDSAAQTSLADEEAQIVKAAAERVARRSGGSPDSKTDPVVSEDEKSFKPNDASRAVFKAMDAKAGDALMERFFDLWEAEGDARRAGSMSAHAYIRNAAHIAVFGARCAGTDPDVECWRAACEEQFHDALRSVAEAFIQAAIDDELAKDAAPVETSGLRGEDRG